MVMQMEAKDKDFRYMATKDLMAELSRLDYKMDERLERQVCSVRQHQTKQLHGLGRRHDLTFGHRQQWRGPAPCRTEVHV